MARPPVRSAEFAAIEERKRKRAHERARARRRDLEFSRGDAQKSDSGDQPNLTLWILTC